MKAPSIPDNEVSRLVALQRYQILDTEAEAAFDELVELAAAICKSPISTITFIDRDREWFKARFGIEDTESPREISFCAHTILKDEPLIVPDALSDERFYDNPFVLEDPPLRFYAAVPLINPEGYALGSLCVIDHVPRELSSEQVRMLKLLGHQVVTLLELRRMTYELESMEMSRQQLDSNLKLEHNRFEHLADQINAIVYEAEYPSFHVTYINEYAKTLLGYPLDDWLSIQDFWEKHIHPEDREHTIEYFNSAALRGEDHDLVYRMIASDGSERWVHDKVGIITDKDGNTTGLHGVAIDITERKQIEQKIKETDLLAQATLDGLASNIVILDAEGNILQTNRSWRKFADENAGDSSRLCEGNNYFTVCESVVGPDEAMARKVVAGIKSVLHDKAPDFALEYPCHSPDEKRWFIARVTQLPVDGSPRVIVSHIDITERKLIEEELKDKKQVLAVLLDNLPGVAYRCGEGKEIMSAGSLALTGYTSEQFGNGEISYKDIIHPDDSQRVWQEIDSACDRHEPFEIEYRIVAASGIEKWVWEQGQGIYNEKGELLRLEGFITDITERHQAQSNYTMLANIIEQTDDAVLITDPNGIITYVNPSFTITSGYASSELLGHKPSVIKSGRHDRNFYKKLWETILSGESFKEVFTNRRKNGELYYEQKTITPIFGDKGKITSFVSTAKDITDQVQMQEALHVSEARLSNAMKIARAGYWEYNIDKNLFTFNDHIYEIFHTSAEIVGGYTMTPEVYEQKYIHPEDRHIVDEEIQAALETTDPDYTRELEHRILYEDGGIGYITVRVFIIKDDHGRTIKTYGVLQDITEQKHKQHRLDLLNTALNEAHEAVFLFDNKSHILEVNDEACKMLGYAREELQCMDMAEINPDFTMKQWTNFWKTISQDISLLQENRYMRRDGFIFPIEINANYFKYDGNSYALMLVRDISQRKKTHNKILRLNYFYKMLGSINSLIVYCNEKKKLYEELCNIAVNIGAFRMTSVCLLEEITDQQQLVPVAVSGYEEGFLDNIRTYVNNRILTDDYPCMQTISQKKPTIINNVSTEKSVSTVWVSESLSRGYWSMAVLPLMSAGTIVGIISFYAAEPDYFDQEEINLLQRLIENISFAVTSLDKEEKLQYMASYDSLTGLANRRLFHDHLDSVLNRSIKNNRNVALLLCDIRQFRHINNVYGTDSGDKILQQTSERLRMLTNDPVNVARLSNDTFAMILHDVKDATGIGYMFENSFFPTLNKEFQVDSKKIQVKFTGGIAVAPNDGTNAESLYKNAEAALKKAKSEGHQFLFYQPEMTARIAETLLIENKLRNALMKDQFLLHYQPKIQAVTRKITGFEALIRWNDPELGLIPPGKFIPILEESGLILEVGKWVIQTAISDYIRWEKKGYQVPKIAVNVSQLQLMAPDFVDTINEEISVFRKKKPIDIEITESLLMTDIEQNISKLSLIQASGVNIAIDDFGTGYSSLSYISRLPIDVLKIDRSFVQPISDDADKMSLVTAIINLAHSLNLKVVAEGVETEEQAKILQLLKCDEMQGFLFYKPMPSIDVDPLLQQKD